ncbi:NAD(P)-binding protein [Meira miltonrushii]|uniref:NAD(P)-binding protein n=1 Tax=Meira miltonrushii TaxID=1280837 RepID=A0A316VF62_9BASI|nr:NAD(P)-binding protein [Meira miltonrushii]PWN36156.1 NAD(P)-binding protein [Meira miltonrushii]
MWYSSTQKSNESVPELSSSRAVVSGGSQGIGAGIALRFALAGASVWVVGRSEERGAEVVKKLQQAALEGARRRSINTKEAEEISKTGGTTNKDFTFFKADLSDVQEINRVAAEIAKRAGKGGVDWLFESQGGPPTGNSPDTPAGIDSAFAVQCLSRYGLAKGLLTSGTIKQGVCFIAVPGQGGKKPIELDDIELKSKRSKWGLNIPRSGARDSAVLDAVTLSFAQQYPNLTFSHIFPGLIGTNAAANQGFPFPIPQAYKAAGLFLPSAEQFAELPFYLHANPEGKRYLRSGEANLFWPWLSRMSISPNVEDQAHRSAIIARLDKYGF